MFFFWEIDPQHQKFDNHWRSSCKKKKKKKVQAKPRTCFKWEGAIFTLSSGPLKLVDKLMYFGSKVSSTKSDVNIRLTKAWTAIDRLSIIWKSNLSDEIKQDFFTRILRVILNKSWKQYPRKQQLYGHLPLISKTIQAMRTRRVGNYWRSNDKLMRDVSLRTRTHERVGIGQPVRTYLLQFCADPGCSLEDLPGAIGDRDG